jgi:hypothetical protein
MLSFLAKRIAQLIPTRFFVSIPKVTPQTGKVALKMHATSRRK